MDISQHCGAEPKYIMTRPFERVDNLVFDGLLYLAQRRFGRNTGLVQAHTRLGKAAP